MSQAAVGDLVRRYPYVDRNRVVKDIINATRQFNMLEAKPGELHLNGGRECRVVMLDGTVPTFYRGTKYNTPVQVFLMEDYPTSSPVCYVRPTAGMSLKNGHRHVDMAGMVYLPYLSEWAPMTHNLTQLCAEMSSTFGANPPLFASPAQQQTPQRPRGPPQPRPRQTSAYPPAYTPSQPRPAPEPPRPKPEQVRRDKEQELTVKLRSELDAMCGQVNTDMEEALKHQSKLSINQQTLKGSMRDLSEHKAELARLLEESQAACSELDAFLEAKKGDKEPEVGDLIEPQDALSAQILDLVAENAALEDCLYYLDKGVTDGVITVDVFLREVRRLARRQFIARATAKRVEQEQVARSSARANFDAHQRQQHRSNMYPHSNPAQARPRRQPAGYGSPPPYTVDAMGRNAAPSGPPAYSAPPPYQPVAGAAAGSAAAWGARAALAGQHGGPLTQSPYGGAYGGAGHGGAGAAGRGYGGASGATWTGYTQQTQHPQRR